MSLRAARSALLSQLPCILALALLPACGGDSGEDAGDDVASVTAGGSAGAAGAPRPASAAGNGGALVASAAGTSASGGAPIGGQAGATSVGQAGAVGAASSGGANGGATSSGGNGGTSNDGTSNGGAKGGAASSGSTNGGAGGTSMGEAGKSGESAAAGSSAGGKNGGGAGSSSGAAGKGSAGGGTGAAGKSGSDNGGSGAGGAPSKVCGGKAPPQQTQVGLCVESGNTHLAAAVKSFSQKDGIPTQSVRIWMSFGSWSDPTSINPQAIVAAKAYKKAGLHVVASLNRKGNEMPSEKDYAKQVTALVEYLMDQPGLSEAVDIWEIGNEPDIGPSDKSKPGTYWENRDPSDYSRRFLIPAAKALHAHGELVTNGAPSWNTKDLAKILDEKDEKDAKKTGWDHVDFVNLHFYRNSLSDLETTIEAFEAVACGKPTMTTEWSMNRKTGMSDDAWAELIAKGWPLLKGHFTYAHYYLWLANPDHMHSPDGLMVLEDGQYKPHGKFWTTYQGFSKK